MMNIDLVMENINSSREKSEKLGLFGKSNYLIALF